MLSGDNGLLKRAGDARDETVVGQEKESVELAYISAAVKKLGYDVDENDLQTELDNSVGSGKTTVSTNDDSTLNVYFTDTEHNYNLDGGSVTRVAEGDINSNYAPYNNPYIPTNFSHIGTENWNSGYTIRGNDGTDNAGSEFVWVPCVLEQSKVKPGDIVCTFQKTLPTTEYSSNPDAILHPSGGTNANVNAEDTSVGLIRSSVGTYGGFYISKYEAGCPLDSSNNEIIPTGSSTITDFTKKARSVLGANPWNYISRVNAITASSNMVTGSNVTSALISGECWDTTLAWITATADSNYATNPVGKGWYVNVSSGVKHTTGYYGTNTNNVFDLGGNMWEWTTENSKDR